MATLGPFGAIKSCPSRPHLPLLVKMMMMIMMMLRLMVMIKWLNHTHHDHCCVYSPATCISTHNKKYWGINFVFTPILFFQYNYAFLFSILENKKTCIIAIWQKHTVQSHACTPFPAGSYVQYAISTSAAQKPHFELQVPNWCAARYQARYWGV